MGHLSKTSEQFHKWARYPDLHSENKNDAKPQGFNGFYAQKEHRPSYHSFLQKYTDGNGAGSEKTDVFWDFGNTSNDSDHFHTLS